MTVQVIYVGFMPTNCYIIYDEQTRQAAVIDPGFDSGKIAASIMGGYTVKMILLTHPHFDHFTACEELRQLLGADVYCYGTAVRFIDGSDNTINEIIRRPTPPVKNPIPLTDGQIIRVGSLEVRVMYTPGHCEGSCCFVAGNAVFTGDCLFKDSIGRCDLPTGNYGIMLKSLAKLKKLYKAEGDKEVFPGHGDSSRLSYEVRFNPYIRESDAFIE